MAQTGRVVRAWKDAFNDFESLCGQTSLAVNFLVQALVCLPNSRCLTSCLALIVVLRRVCLFLHYFTANAAYVL